MGLIYALVCEARAYPEGMDLQTNALTNTQVFSVKVKDLAGLPWMAAARWCMHTIYRVKRKYFFFNRRAPLTFKTHFKCLLNVRRILNETKKTITFKHKNWRLIFQVKLQLVLVYVPFVRKCKFATENTFLFLFCGFFRWRVSSFLTHTINQQSAKWSGAFVFFKRRKEQEVCHPGGRKKKKKTTARKLVESLTRKYRARGTNLLF